MQKSKGAAKELALELGRSPDDDELAGRLGVTRRGAVQAESSAPVAWKRRPVLTLEAYKVFVCVR
jgi:DNA-directed RNA polymerase specialized sigma subunit